MPAATATAPRPTTKRQPPASRAQALTRNLCRVVDNPLAFVLWAYPWGTGTLATDPGPDTWQRTVLLGLAQHLRQHETAAQVAIASGHGIGKGALVAWLIQWAMATRPNLQGVVTANTQSQLFTKTWRELAKWHQLLRPELRQLFKWSHTRYTHTTAPDTWYVAAIPWSEHNSVAFQGAHDRHVFVAFDESSAIPDAIWEASDGSMTTPRAIRLATGNPTRTTGRFRQAFAGGRFHHRWQTYQVDSRTCRKANTAQLEQWVTDYGEESDYVKVRVRGLFPSASVEQFISEAHIAAAHARWKTGPSPQGYPKILGVDVAREGDDASVLLLRQGPCILWTRAYRDCDDTMRLAGYVAEAIDAEKPAATFVDLVGVGAGTYDRLKQLGYKHVHGINAGSVPRDTRTYSNKRAEMWGLLRDWLKDFGALDRDGADQALCEELQGPNYHFDGQNRYVLERKKDMKSRGLASPDIADACALSFAQPVAMPAPVVTPVRPAVRAASGAGWMR